MRRDGGSLFKIATCKLSAKLSLGGTRVSEP